ncbi:tetratricopeptide repeat protein [Henriciella sp.]|uniref:tetratricopeptide repeat protein n=1 Tax=Henriciella sp. TaxID=1968823 RepID=UPI002628FD58|nr:tetratricopeptide repeat protein [Henriciella sp.]
MTMRFGSAAAIAVLLLSACASSGNREDELVARLAAARADAQTNASADNYSQFLIARYASLINDPNEAAAKYALVASSRPDDLSIIDRAVFSALLADQFKLARSISAKTGADTLVNSDLARIVLAADSLSRARYDEVPVHLEGQPPALFNSLVFTSLRAWALFGKGQCGEAQLALLEASSGDPYLDSLLLNLLGLLEVACGNDEDALATFSRIDTNGTLIAMAAENYARLLSATGQNEKALDTLERFRSSAGHNPVVTDLITRLEAGERLEIHRADAREGAAVAVYVPAAALASQSQTDLPGVYYSIALTLDPELHAARALWADALDVAGRREESIAMLETIPASSPYYTTARGQLAWALRRDDQKEKALKLVYHTLSANPGRDLKIQMGDLLRSLGREGEAATVFTEIIDADDATGNPDWRLYYARGALREGMGLWPLAEEDLKTAKTLNPNAPEVLNYLGYSWIDRGINLEEGLDLIRKALTLRPNSGAITDSLGWAHYKLGNIDAAIGYLERAAELEPGLAEISDHLGDAYWAAGRQTEARFQWQRAITLMEDQDEIEDMRRKMLTGPKPYPVQAQRP